MPEYRAIEGAAGEEDIPVGKTVKTLTIPAEGSRAKVQVRTAGIIYSINKEAPFATALKTGSTLEVGDILTVTGTELAALRMVRATTTNANAHVRYERRIN